MKKPSLLGNLHGFKHGLTRTPTHNSWVHMRSRCRNPKVTQYKDYGGRGITVCARWDSFETFLTDMGERPPGTSIDRIDGDGNYEPSNCRWAIPREQQRTMRHAHNGQFVSARG